MAEKKSNPLDLNGSNFNPNMYLDKLFKVNYLIVSNPYLIIYKFLLGMHFKTNYGP